MARHRAQLTRQALLERYAHCHGMRVSTAAEFHAYTSIEDLRGIVEALEEHSMTLPFPERRSFARSLPTTTVQGKTR